MARDVHHWQATPVVAVIRLANRRPPQRGCYVMRGGRVLSSNHSVRLRFSLM